MIRGTGDRAAVSRRVSRTLGGCHHTISSSGSSAAASTPFAAAIWRTLARRFSSGSRVALVCGNPHLGGGRLVFVNPAKLRLCLLCHRCIRHACVVCRVYDIIIFVYLRSLRCVLEVYKSECVTENAFKEGGFLSPSHSLSK